jgi:hypothetical protein
MLQTMLALSKLELQTARMGGIDCLDFIVDGNSLFARFPESDLVAALLTSYPTKPDQKVLDTMLVIVKRLNATRLGCGTAKWRRQALEELLLLCEPKLKDGSRCLYSCANCTCSHISCIIEKTADVFVWRDFRSGMQLSSDSHKITVGPFHFDARAYLALFEPLLTAAIQPEGH